MPARRGQGLVVAEPCSSLLLDVKLQLFPKRLVVPSVEQHAESES